VTARPSFGIVGGSREGGWNRAHNGTLWRTVSSIHGFTSGGHAWEKRASTGTTRFMALEASMNNVIYLVGLVVVVLAVLSFFGLR
jgi:hypothetical protein